MVGVLEIGLGTAGRWVLLDQLLGSDLEDYIIILENGTGQL